MQQNSDVIPDNRTHRRGMKGKKLYTAWTNVTLSHSSNVGASDKLNFFLINLKFEIQSSTCVTYSTERLLDVWEWGCSCAKFTWNSFKHMVRENSFPKRTNRKIQPNPNRRHEKCSLCSKIYLNCVKIHKLI